MQLYAFKKTVLTLLLTAFGVASFPQSYYSVFVATDRHEKTSNLQDVVTQARDYVVQTYNDSLSAVVHGGDLVGSGGGNNPSGSLNTVNAEFLGKLTNLTNSDIYYTWGSHDANMEKGNTNGYLVSSGVVTRDMSGAVDLDGKAWLWGIDYNEMTNYNTATSGAEAFTNWVNGLPSDDHRAIIIMSHVPMHYRRGDNHGAVTWLTAINEAASDKDIVFLWGHNHTGSTGNDTNHAYVAVGGTVTPEASSSKGEPADGGGPGGGSGSGTAGTPVTIQFTYMNAGYITTGTIHGWNGSSITVTNDSIIIDNFSTTAKYATRRIGRKDPVPYVETNTFVAGWNWWAPTVATTATALQTALGDLTIEAQDGTTPESLVPGQMYKVHTPEGGTFTLSGTTPESVSYDFGNGPNWFGTTAETNLDDLDITPATGDKIVSQDGGFAVYQNDAWTGTLTTLQPSKGYIYWSAASAR